MSIFDFFSKKNKLPQGVTESAFECFRGELKIGGTEYRPEGENLPVAIVSHGFMANQDTTREYAKALASVGYCAYCFDFCGGSVMKNKSGGETTSMSVLTEVLDLEAVIAYAKSLEYTSDKVLLMGCSQGGFVSALTAAKNPGIADKLILFYPALCIPDDARKGRMMFAKFDPKNIPEIVNCGPMKLGRCYVADVVDMDPYKEISGYTGEVLLVHGDKDNIVDVGYGIKAIEIYKETAKKAKLHIIKGAGHGFKAKDDAEAVGLVKGFAEVK